MWSVAKRGRKRDHDMMRNITKRHFSRQSWLKLARKAYNGKNKIPLLCFIFKMNTKEDIWIYNFKTFLTMRIFISLIVDEIFPRTYGTWICWNFQAISYDCRDAGFSMFMQLQYNDLCWQFQVFVLWKIIKRVVWMIEMFFLLLGAKMVPIFEFFYSQCTYVYTFI